MTKIATRLDTSILNPATFIDRSVGQEAPAGGETPSTPLLPRDTLTTDFAQARLKAKEALDRSEGLEGAMNWRARGGDDRARGPGNPGRPIFQPMYGVVVPTEPPKVQPMYGAVVPSDPPVIQPMYGAVVPNPPPNDPPKFQPMYGGIIRPGPIDRPWPIDPAPVDPNPLDPNPVAPNPNAPGGDDGSFDDLLRTIFSNPFIWQLLFQYLFGGAAAQGRDS